jgi:hypothetical protein
VCAALVEHGRLSLLYFSTTFFLVTVVSVALRLSYLTISLPRLSTLIRAKLNESSKESLKSARLVVQEMQKAAAVLQGNTLFFCSVLSVQVNGKKYLKKGRKINEETSRSVDGGSGAARAGGGCAGGRTDCPGSQQYSWPDQAAGKHI